MTRRELLVRASILGISATAIGGLVSACGSRGTSSSVSNGGATPQSAAPTTTRSTASRWASPPPPTGEHRLQRRQTGLRRPDKAPVASERRDDGHRANPVRDSTVRPGRHGLHVPPSGRASTSSLRSTPEVRRRRTRGQLERCGQLQELGCGHAGPPPGADPLARMPPAEPLTDSRASRPSTTWTLQVTLKYPFAEFPTSLGHPSWRLAAAYAMKPGSRRVRAEPNRHWTLPLANVGSQAGKSGA